MKKFILNLLFVIGHVSRPIAIGGWMFGRFWVNHPLDYTPTWPPVRQILVQRRKLGRPLETDDAWRNHQFYLFAILKTYNLSL